MGLLLSAVQSVAATPLPTPEVIVKTVHDVVTVPAATPEVMKSAQLGLLFLAGLGGSWMHQFFEALSRRKDGWSTGVNVTLQFLFGVTVAALAAFVNGELQLTFSSVSDFVSSLLVVLGTSQGRYMFKKWTDSLGSDNVLPVPTPQTDSAEQNDPVPAGV